MHIFCSQNSTSSFVFSQSATIFSALNQMMHVGLCRVTPIYVHQIWFCLSAAPIVWTNNGCCFVLYAEVTKQMLMLWMCTAMIAVLVQRRYDPTTQYTCLSGTSSKLTPWVVMVAFDSTTANRSIDGPRYDDITDLDRVTFDLDCWLRLWTNHVPRDGLDSRLGLYTADDRSWHGWQPFCEHTEQSLSCFVQTTSKQHWTYLQSQT